MKKIIVNKKNNGKSLTTFLLGNFNGLNINTIYKAFRKKDIRINNIKINKNYNVYTGDEITIFIPDNLLYKNFDLSFIYEDDNIIAINKPVGIEVISNNNDISLTKLLQTSFSTPNFPAPCHRLDRNTSGLVIFAKNEESLNILMQKFKNHEIEKHYKCTVFGIPTKSEATLVAYLFKDSKKSLVYISDENKKGYQKIITSYKIISRNNDNTCTLDVILHTGRTHQIRAHLAHIGYPIIGDGKYGINEINKKFKRTTQDLCSYKLKFNFSTDSGILEYLKGKEISL